MAAMGRTELRFFALKLHLEDASELDHSNSELPWVKVESHILFMSEVPTW